MGRRITRAKKHRHNVMVHVTTRDVKEVMNDLDCHSAIVQRARP